MKPLKLSIEGLNSFEEKQIIDFEELTSCGFFGIFGPTGSGKSSVLDGITLALYGNIARKSSNYINVNCDRLNVNFEFQISAAEVKRYIVDREFKRSKETIRAGKCKIVDKESGDVLAEGTKSVNAAVEEIIGLNLDDFTRTVVLPQGKFSEFLKLEGKPRREMLERLFNLEKYGDELGIKLSREINKQRNEYNILTGQLLGYEDVTEENINAGKEKLKEIIDNITVMNCEFEKLKKKCEDAENLYKLQKELNEYLQKKKELNKKKEQFDKIAEDIKKGEAASKVMPYLKAYESTMESYKKNEEELFELKEKFKAVSRKKDENEKKYKLIKEKKDVELPKLLIEEQKINDAITEQKALKLIENSIKNLKSNKENITFKIKENDEKIKENDVLGKNINDKIQEHEKNYESLKIDEQKKVNIQKGVLLEQKILSIKETIERDSKKKESIDRDNEIVLKEGLKLKDSIDTKKEYLKKLEEESKELESKCPGDQNSLLKVNDELSIVRENEKSVLKLSNENKNLQSKIEEFKTKLINKSYIEKQYSDNIVKLKEDLQKAQNENYAIMLRKNLKENEVCPVCGATHHTLKNLHISEVTDVAEIEESISKAEENLKNISREIIEIKSRNFILEEQYKNNLKELEEYEAVLKKATSESLRVKFETLKAQIEKYTSDKEKLQKEVNEVNQMIIKQEGERASKRDVYSSNRKQLEVLIKEISENNNNLTSMEEELGKLKADTAVLNFSEEMIRINKCERERNILENEIKKLRFQLEDLKALKENIQKELLSYKENIAKIQSSLEENEKSKEEKINSIKNKIGEKEDAVNLLTKVKDQIKNISEQYKVLEKEKGIIEKEYNEINEKLISLQSKDKELAVRKVNEENMLKSKLLDNNFEDIENVKQKYLEDSVIEKYKEQIDEYNEMSSKIQGAVESLTKKINNRTISEDEYNEIINERTVFSDNLSKLNEEKIKYDEITKKLEQRMKEQKELLLKKKEMDHKSAMLSDLDKLFKGKKFVEFVAGYQLKYVSLEASRRLKEITRGAYGLEVDENGKFIIRDYKNGGAARDASTLSGGETFLASLALALALSAQIQLKGTAPLELFFLDEGFGTLDDELLEVVMSSLERIHNEKLKIGIISHVESIKNRVPIKLVITPAECGAHGSIAKIERN